MCSIAADSITKLPKSESDLPEWQTAIEVLMLCSRGGDSMLARIGVMKALTRNLYCVASMPLVLFHAITACRSLHSSGSASTLSQLSTSASSGG